MSCGICARPLNLTSCNQNENIQVSELSFTKDHAFVFTCVYTSATIIFLTPFTLASLLQRVTNCHRHGSCSKAKHNAASAARMV